MIWIALVVALVVLALVIWVMVASSRRGPIITGGPTPEEARVRLDKVDADIETKAEEVKNAPLAQKVDRLRALRDLGRMRGKN